MSLLEVRDLRVGFGRGAHRAAALDGVSVTLDRGETLGVVGESGSGKSTLGNAILGLVPVESGSILFDGADVTALRGRQRRRLATRLQVVFQDPYGSLNPRRTIGDGLGEPLRVHHGVSAREARHRVVRVLERVGLDADAADRFPAQFSGGQRQRIAIARAVVMGSELIVCDEPTSALDLSVQAQVLNLLLELQEQLGIAYLFISHDIDVIRHMSHRVAVLYRGRIVESGDAERVTSQPGDPYTRALLAAAPSVVRAP